MARILRRRVAQMPKVASSRRNLASEINQYLKLGLNAQQIIEKMIPDDPSITPEMMDPIFDMMAKAQPKPLAQRAAGVQQVAGSMLGQAPAIPVGQSPSEVVTSPSQVVAASPASSPRAAAPLKPEQLPPRATGQRLAAIQQTSTVSDLIDQAARIAATNADFTEIDEFKDLRDEIAIIFNDEFDSQNMYGDADVAIAETVQKLRDESVALPPPEPAPEPAPESRAQAKAEVSQSIQEAQIAENAEQLKSSFRQMYNAIKEGSGIYDFADNVQRAVPLFLRAAQASKASGDDVRLLQTIIRKSVREAELADKQAGRTFKQEQFDAKVEETKRKEDVKADVAELEWGNKNDFQDKKTEDALRVAQEKGKQTRLNKRTRGTPATSQEQMLGKGTALDANKKIAAAQADKEKSKKNLEAGLKDPRIAKLVKLNDKGGLTELKELTDAEVKRLLPIYRLIGEIEASDEIIKIQTAREKAAREQMANRADIDAIDQEQTGANKSTRTRTPEEIKALGAEAAGVFPSE
jgi:hypothetical protein